MCAFVHEVGGDTDLELDVLIQRHPLLDDEPMVVLSGMAYTETEEEAREQLELLETFSERHRSIQATVNALTAHGGIELSDEAELVPLHESWGWISDNIGTGADFEALRPNFEEIMATFPASPSNLLLFNWGGYVKAPMRPSMAFSLDDELFYALYIAWENPADSEQHVRWTTEHMRAWEPFAGSTMLADENLVNRPARFVSDENLARLDQLRAEWDPRGVFVSWLGRPELRPAPA